MTAVVLVVGVLIVAALAVAFGSPVGRSRRTVVVERERPVTRVRRVVRETPVVERVPVVEEVVEDRY